NRRRVARREIVDQPTGAMRELATTGRATGSSPRYCRARASRTGTSRTCWAGRGEGSRWAPVVATVNGLSRRSAPGGKAVVQDTPGASTAGCEVPSDFSFGSKDLGRRLDEPVPPDIDRGTRWSVHTLRPAPGYIGALAIEGCGWRISQWQWPG